MANDCSRLMKDALDNYLGIDMRYKLDDTLAALGKQKFSAKQLEGYLTKQGVSPKEIKQSGIFEGMADDNRAISADDWLSMSGGQKVNTFRVAPEDTQYDSITLGRKGEGDTSKYREILSVVKKPKNNAPYEPHFEEEMSPKQSLLGWRRTHVDEINGKKTLVLNEFQSDWAQTERAGRGTFESNKPTINQVEEARNLVDNYIKDNNIDMDELGRGLVKLPKEIEEADKIIDKFTKETFADFPMSEIKHHQFQIVGAIDDALKQGIDTIAIPIQREKELIGSAGVTKFYESLNQKVLPDIRKKLEKQGMRIKVSMEDYGTGELRPNKDGGSISLLKDRHIRDNLDISHISEPELHEALHKVVKDIRNELLSSKLSRVSWEAMENKGVDIEGELFHKLLTGKYLTQYARNLPTFASDFFNGNSGRNNELLRFLKTHIPGTPANRLHILEIEEIPNKKVNWDVYGIVGALGLTSMLGSDANAKELPNIVSPKTEQVESQVPATRQEAEQGTLQNILNQNKVAPLNEPKGILQQYKEMGLISQEEKDSYGFKKDDTILDDYRVDMKRQMPKTIQEQEGNNLSAHRPTKRSGWTIGRGYDLTGRKLENVIADFKSAGISEGQARAFFQHKPIKINAKQSKALGDIAWRERVATARRIGLPIDELNREGFLKVMSLVYRGDIVKGGSDYRGKLYNLAKKGDIKAIDRFVLNDSVKTLKSNVLYNRWKKFNKP